MNSFNELDDQGRVTFLMANTNENGMLDELQDKNGNNIRLNAGQRIVMECVFVEECFGASSGDPLLKFSRAADFALLTGNRIPRNGYPNLMEEGQPTLPDNADFNADGWPAHVGWQRPDGSISNGQVFVVNYTAPEDGVAVLIGTRGAAAQGKLRINKATIETPPQIVIGN